MTPERPVTDELIALADELAQRIRSATIAECARLCDIREREYDTHTSQTNRGAAIGARYCAAAIRALEAK